MSTSTQLASFGAGCFWGVEARFREVQGVMDATVGYMGGALAQPDYRTVCSGASGHAEVVQLSYDPQQLDYETLLTVFFDMHNPTTLNRQGPDMGTQYRSVIFYHSPEQQTLALKAVADADASGRWQQPVVTRVEKAPTFWPAEEYHQRYLEKNGLGVCHL